MLFPSAGGNPREDRMWRVSISRMVIEPAVGDACVVGVAQQVVHSIDAEGIADDDLGEDQAHSREGQVPGFMRPTPTV